MFIAPSSHLLTITYNFPEGTFTRVGVRSTIYLFSGKIDRSGRNMEIYKWKWIVLGALGCMNNANFEKKKTKEMTTLC